MSPLVVVIVVVLVGSATLGLLVRRRLSGDRSQDHPLAGLEGLSVNELVVPARTLSALVLAFAVVSVHGSYEDTGRQAATEAAAVLAMGEDAMLLTPDARSEVVGQLRCYARSVASSDWPAQAAGGPSPLTDAAADRVTMALQRAIVDGRNTLAAAAVLDDNAQRIQVRLQRFEDGRSSIPLLVWVLLLLTLATMVAGLAALVRPGVRRPVHLVVLVTTTLVFGLALVVIDDLDHPYGGLARIEPTAMLVVEGRLAALPGGPAAAPCDVEGVAG